MELVDSMYLNSWFMRIQSYSPWHELARSIICLRNALPGLSTLQAWASSPMSDRISLFLAARLVCNHVSINCCKRAFFSSGSFIVMFMLLNSIAMPRKMVTVVGFSSFSACNGRELLTCGDDQLQVVVTLG